MRPDFLDLLENEPRILAEGAIAEQLRRRPDIALHETLFNTPLILEEHGRACLAELYGEYRQVAAQAGLPMLLCAPTWRVDRQRLTAAGLDPGLNRQAVRFMQQLLGQWQTVGSPLYLAGLVGPRNDCYTPAAALATAEALRYHDWQVAELAAAGVDLVIAQTFPAVGEAVGVAKACRRHDIPCLVSFVINRRGELLDGTPLLAAIRQADAATDNYPAGFMVNCVHPSFLLGSSPPAELFHRLVGIQANASSLEPGELDGARKLHQDDHREWGRQMLVLNRQYGVKILGGCCGTDRRFIAALATT